MQPAPDRERDGIQVIARAAAILDAVVDRDQIGIADLAREVGLPRSTVHRLIGALEAEEMLAPSRAGGTRIGPAMLRLGAAARDVLSADSHGALRALSESLGETVDLAVLSGSEVLVVDQVIAANRLQAASAVGSRLPAHCTANGKALLAEMMPQGIHDLFPAELPVRTPHTITTRVELSEALEKVRADGVAVDREEHTLGICAVSAVVPGEAGVEMAITVVVPAQRFRESEREITGALRRTCSSLR